MDNNNNNNSNKDDNKLKITVSDLAIKYNIPARKVRRILREEGVKKEQYYWIWRSESDKLAKVENILSRLN